MALSLLVKILSLVTLLLLNNSQPFLCICEFDEKIECIMITDSCYNGITHKEIWMNGYWEDFYIKIKQKKSAEKGLCWTTHCHVARCSLNIRDDTG